MELAWKIWTEAKSAAKARRVGELFCAALGCGTLPLEIAPHEGSGGYLIRLSSALESSRWPEALLEALTLAQRVGRAWTLTGEIARELDATSKEAAVSGITLLGIFLRNDL